uniref:Uncharacterized protein n=1 Tax=Anguilla anguilla TaxID=7936 RepID=A0A0E9R0A0_ANGAN
MRLFPFNLANTLTLVCCLDGLTRLAMLKKWHSSSSHVDLF